MMEQKIEGEFLVIRIPLSELPRISTTYQPTGQEPLKGMKGKTRDFVHDLLANYRHNTPIERRGQSISDLGYKHRVDVNGALKEMERRGMLKVDRLPEFPFHIKTFTIL
jgi:hypothetical protein